MIIDKIAWNKNPITAQQIIDEVTKQIEDKYKEQDK